MGRDAQQQRRDRHTLLGGDRRGAAAEDERLGGQGEHRRADDEGDRQRSGVVVDLAPQAAVARPGVAIWSDGQRRRPPPWKISLIYAVYTIYTIPN